MKEIINMWRETLPGNYQRITFLAACLALFGVIVIKQGCGLFVARAIETQILSCEAVVSNPEIEVELGGGPITELLINGDGIFFNDRDQYMPGCFGQFSIPGFAEADWIRLISKRIDEVMPDPASSSIFRRFTDEAQGWCVVPGTLVCRVASTRLENCLPEPEPVSNVVPLPVCAAMLPACLVVSCDGAACTEISFDDVVPVGQTSELNESRIVNLTNNCAATADVSVSVDGEVFAVGERGDFVVGGNSCFPSDLESGVLPLAQGESCSFNVQFAPASPGDHRGRTVFTSRINNRAALHTINLTGRTEGGVLQYTVPDLPDPQQIPQVLCVDEFVEVFDPTPDDPLDPVQGCTTARQLDVSNQGPGAVTISSVRLEENTGFEFVAPTVLPNEDEGDELALDDTRSYAFRWCGAVGLRAESTLVVDSNDPTQPTFARTLLREPNGCDTVVLPGPVCGNGVVDAGEQCVDGNSCSDCALITAYSFEGTNPDSLVRAITGNPANNHDATLNGATRSANIPLDAGLCGGVDLARLGQAISLDGVDDFISITDHDDLDLTSGNYTLAAWIRPSGFGESLQGRIIDHGGASGAVPPAVGNTPGAGWTMRIAGPADTGDGSIDLFVNQNQLVQVNSDAALGEVTTGQWQHVAVTSENVAGTVTARLYIDGQVVSPPVSVTEAPLDQATEIRVGNRFNGAVNTERNFNGLIDEVRIYNRALDASEITTMMCSPLITPDTP